MLRVGLATVDFTPRPGLPLMGNYREDYAARGVHDPLCAKAVVFADSGGGRAAVLALDLCMVDRENVALMRRLIARQSRVPPAHVLIHATHTHSGPAPNDRYSFGMNLHRHAGEIKAFLSKAATAVALAEQNLAEATLSVGRAVEDRVSFNRRLRRRDGATQMNWEALAPGFDPSQIAAAWGTTDPQLTCLVVECDGRPAAAVVNFALHPAILAGDNWLYSADFPGYLAEAMSRIVGGGFVTVFLNGCSADVNHVDYRDPLQGRGHPMAQRVGYMLAAAAHAAVRTRQPIEADRVEVATERVALRRQRISDEQVRWCQRVLEHARLSPPRGMVDGLPDAFWADLRLRMAREQDAPAETEVMTIRLGDAAIVGLPGEIFCQSGLQIKRRSCAPYTLVAELSNDAIGYVPPPEAFQQGGYEPTLGSTLFAEDSAERLLEAAVAQLDRLFGARQ